MKKYQNTLIFTEKNLIQSRSPKNMFRQVCMISRNLIFFHKCCVWIKENISMIITTENTEDSAIIMVLWLYLSCEISLIPVSSHMGLLICT